MRVANARGRVNLVADFIRVCHLFRGNPCVRGKKAPEGEIYDGPFYWTPRVQREVAEIGDLRSREAHEKILSRGWELSAETLVYLIRRLEPTTLLAEQASQHCSRCLFPSATPLPAGSPAKQLLILLSKAAWKLPQVSDRDQEDFIGTFLEERLIPWVRSRASSHKQLEERFFMRVKSRIETFRRREWNHRIRKINGDMGRASSRTNPSARSRGVKRTIKRVPDPLHQILDKLLIQVLDGGPHAPLLQEIINGLEEPLARTLLATVNDKPVYGRGGFAETEDISPSAVYKRIRRIRKTLLADPRIQRLLADYEE